MRADEEVPRTDEDMERGMRGQELSRGPAGSDSAQVDSEVSDAGEQTPRGAVVPRPLVEPGCRYPTHDGVRGRVAYEHHTTRPGRRDPTPGRGAHNTSTGAGARERKNAPPVSLEVVLPPLRAAFKAARRPTPDAQGARYAATHAARAVQREAKSITGPRGREDKGPDQERRQQ